jgi:hypothetical protein
MAIIKSNLAHPESGLPPEPDARRFVALVGDGTQN